MDDEGELSELIIIIIIIIITDITFSAAYEIQTVTCLVEVHLADCSIHWSNIVCGLMV